MISELLRKWFGLEPRSCATCEVLNAQLASSERERRELLHKLLDKAQPEPSPTVVEEPVPVTPQFIPWRVRQQMLEAEDRRRASLLKDRQQEIDKLESELGVKDAAQ